MSSGRSEPPPVKSAEPATEATTAEDSASLEFVRLMARGDKRGLARLYERESRSILGYLIEFTRDRPFAEDTLHETFLAAWRGASRFEGRSRVRTWLFGIARRQARDRSRGRRTLAEFADDTDTGTRAGDPQEIALARLTLSEVAERIGQLSLIHREVLSLSAVHGLSYQEMADVLGVPIGTIRSRLSNARRLLRIAYGPGATE